MKYFVFKTNESKILETISDCLGSFESSMEAKAFARDIRAELPLNGTVNIEIITTNNQLEAVQILEEKIEKTIATESEK